MLPTRFVATLLASLAVALVAAAGLAGTATTAAADGMYFGFGFDNGPRMPPPRGWGPPPPPMWGGQPAWRPGPPPPVCRPRWVDQPVVDPWGRVVRYQRVEIMDCGPGRRHHHRW